MERKQNISMTIIRRLPKYYRYLSDLEEKGISKTSSQELSSLTGFTASQIRQDLNNFGGFGQQGYGYNVEGLKNQLGEILGLDSVYSAVIVGAGNLGTAIVNYRGFEDAGFSVKAMFDKDEALIGKKIKDYKIRSTKELDAYIKEHNIDIGIITAPKDAAQSIADHLIDAGVRSIWNFAPVDLEMPENIIIENVRLNESLFVLSYFLKQGLSQEDSK